VDRVPAVDARDVGLDRTWVEWIRLVAVAAFAIGWTLVSIPKAWRESQ